MRRRTSTFLTILLAGLLVTATPAEAATTAVGSVHTTESDFQTATTLENVSVVGSGTGASVGLASGGPALEDSFEDDAVGSFPNNWTEASGTAEIDDSRASQGSKSLRVDANSRAQHEISGAGYRTDDQSFDIYVPDGHKAGYYVNEAGTTVISVFLNKSGLYYTEPGATSTQLVTNADLTGEWTTISITQFDTEADEATLSWDSPSASGSTTMAFRNPSSNGYNIIKLNNIGSGGAAYYDDIVVGNQPATKGSYIGANHSVSEATQGWTNLTLQNAEATVTWQGWTGSSWTDVSSATYTTTGNYSQALAGGYSKWRVNTTFVKTGSDPIAQLHDEGVLFSNDAPIIDSNSATPSGGTTLSTGDPELSIDISDATFGTPQGETLDATFYVDGSAIGSKTVQNNGTVSHNVTGLTGGSHTWHVKVDDSYGGSTTSQTFSFATPSELTIRNESAPSQLIDNATVSLKFYYENPVKIEERTTTNGTVSFDNLPIDRPFVVIADAEGYTPRRIYVESLIQAESIYLVPESKQSVTTRFQLQDFSGEYPDGVTVLKVQRAINGSWQTVEGDFFGASGGFASNLRYNVRHRLILLNTRTGQSEPIGPFTPIADETVTLTIETDGTLTLDRGGPQVIIEPQVRQVRATSDAQIAARVLNNSAGVTAWDVTMTYRNDSTTAVIAQTSRTTDGGTFAPTLDLTDRAGGEVEVVVEYTLQSGATGQTNATFIVAQDYQNQYALLTVLGGVGDHFPNRHASTVLSGIAIFVSVLASLAVAGTFRTSSAVVGLVAVVSLAGFALIGWVGYGPVFVSGAGWVALVGLRRGI
jgi:hypothetical protein